MKRKILHQPRLDTIRMVENFIIKHSGEFKKKALWQNLPKKMMYQTYCVIIERFLEYERIEFTKDKKIIWKKIPLTYKYFKKHPELEFC